MDCHSSHSVRCDDSVLARVECSVQVKQAADVMLPTAFSAKQQQQVTLLELA